MPSLASPGAVQSYSLVQATVRALYTQLLSRQMWESLAQAADSDAVLTLLSDTLYAPYLDIDRTALSPRRTVYQIRWHLADVYAKLIRTSPKSAQNVLRELWHHYEVDNIKVALRGVEAGATWQQVLHLLYPMAGYITVGVDELEKMVRAGSVARAIDTLVGTDYHRYLSYALGRYEEEGNLFPLEVALDLGYRRRLWAAIFGLRGLDRQMAMQTVGTALDTDNLLWAVRYRVYHRMSEAEIINYTLPMGYEVRDADIQAIARGADIGSVIFWVYPHLSDELQGLAFETGEGLERLERAFLLMLLRRCRRVFLGAPFHIGLLLAYLWLNEYEIRDLTVVIEGKASAMPAQALWPVLIMPRSAP